jgi:hypothetical protein
MDDVPCYCMHKKKPKYLFNFFNMCFPVRTSFSFLMKENMYIQEIAVDLSVYGFRNVYTPSLGFIYHRNFL